MFNFGDEVFPNGQELIILVTELTANPHSAHFLAKYRVEEFFIHDKALMFRQRQKEILSRLKNSNWIKISASCTIFLHEICAGFFHKMPP